MRVHFLLLFFLLLMPLGSIGMVPCSGIYAWHHNILEKSYVREYHNNGHLKAEGWTCLNGKEAFWYFYHPNGNFASKGSFKNDIKDGYWYFFDVDGRIVKEGHYNEGVATSWWIFYDIATATESKFEYQDNRKNGFAFIYIHQKLTRAEKYKNDRKIGEWTSIWSFKRDNLEASL